MFEVCQLVGEVMASIIFIPKTWLVGERGIKKSLLD